MSKDPTGGTEARLRTYLDCQTAISQAALADTGADDFAGMAVETLAATLGARATGWFGRRDQGFDLVRGTGWMPHLTPHRLPLADPPPPGVHRISALPDVVGCRLLRAHDLADGIVADVALPRGDHGILGVFGVEHLDDPALVQLVSSVAELVGAGLGRRDLADQVQANERRLQEAQSLAHLGSYDWNMLTDTNVWSDELYRIYGAEPGAFNASYDEFISRVHPDDREQVMAVHREAFESHEPYRTRERIVRPDGSIRILDTTGEVVVGHDGNPVRMRGICIDMTEQIEADEHRSRLERAEQRRRQAFQINDGVVQGLTSVIWAIEAGVPDAALLAANETLENARSMMSGLLDLDDATLDELTRSVSPPNPLAAGWRPPVAPTSPAAVAKDSRTRKVVIADDSADLRLLLRMQLVVSAGFDVVGEAGTGPEAVELVRRSQPDLLLLDLAMPGGNGLEAIPEIRAASPETRIVVLSGFSRDHLGDRALAAGATAYVEKGRLDELLATINAEGV